MSILTDYFAGKDITQKNYFVNKNLTNKDLSTNIGQIQNNLVKNRDFNKALLSFNLKFYYIGKSCGKPKTPEDLENRISYYFLSCINEGWTPTWEGIAVVSNYTLRTLWEIENGKLRPDLTEVFKDAKNYIAMYDAGAVTSGEIPASVYQFRSKNFYGMRDIQEIRPYVENEITNEDAENVIKRLPG